jgi:tripartite-type tricarboxylate transporter receptor subunit TctC
MRFLKTLAAALCGLALGSALAQQPYPNKPIKIVVAYAAGQGTDIATRYLAEHLSRDIGQPIVIDNRPGAGGNIGTAAAAQAPGDGYTLTMGTNATHVLNEYLYPKLTFDAEKDFEPVALVGTFPMVLAVAPGLPVNSAAEFVAAVQKRSHNIDIALPSTSARLVVELLRDRAKVPLVGIPYKGSGNAMTDLQGGQLPAIVDTPTALRPHLATGKVRAIGVTSAKPSSLVPGVRPFAEQGFKGFEVIAWNALYAPKGTPPAVVGFLNAAVNKVLAKPEVRQRLLELGFEPAGGTSAQLRDFARAERAKWGPLIKSAGLKAD